MTPLSFVYLRLGTVESFDSQHGFSVSFSELRFFTLSILYRTDVLHPGLAALVLALGCSLLT